jgi:hypothetical protein
MIDSCVILSSSEFLLEHYAMVSDSILIWAGRVLEDKTERIVVGKTNIQVGIHLELK